MTIDEFREGLKYLIRNAGELPINDMIEALEKQCEELAGQTGAIRGGGHEPGGEAHT